MSYFLTERLSTSIGYGFNMVDYQSGDYNNYKGQTLTHGFDYLLNEKTTLIKQVNRRHTISMTNMVIQFLRWAHKSASAINMRKNGI